MTYTLKLTLEELDFLYNRCSHKAQRLEEANLKDIPCYHMAWQLMTKLATAIQNKDSMEETN